MRRLLTLLFLGAVVVALISGADGGSTPAGRSTHTGSACDPNYAGACLDPGTYDYDCANGIGDGPGYTGTVEVVGSDHYGLDADGDGSGCDNG